MSHLGTQCAWVVGHERAEEPHIAPQVVATLVAACAHAAGRARLNRNVVPHCKLPGYHGANLQHGATAVVAENPSETCVVHLGKRQVHSTNIALAVVAEVRAADPNRFGLDNEVCVTAAWWAWVGSWVRMQARQIRELAKALVEGSTIQWEETPLCPQPAVSAACTRGEQIRSRWAPNAAAVPRCDGQPPSVP